METCCLTQNGLLIFSLPSILYPFVNHLFYPMRGTLNGYQFARHAYLSMNAISFFKYLPLPPLSMFFIIAVDVAALRLRPRRGRAGQPRPLYQRARQRADTGDLR